MKKRKYKPPLDKGIAPFVKILASEGIETYASCEGGKGHSYSEPTIRFHGEIYEGFRVLAVALAHGLPVSQIQQFWAIHDLQPVGPDWEIIFSKKANG